MSPAEMDARLSALFPTNEALRDLFAGPDTEHKGAQVTLKVACAALDRLAAMEAEAKQAREDEAWALDAAVTIHPVMGERQWIPRLWSVRYCDGVRTLEVTAPTIHAALRALRVKVEGGAR